MHFLAYEFLLPITLQLPYQDAASTHCTPYAMQQTMK
jgi:hypothetical protein